MPPRNASRTAVATAYLRAAHQLLDARPLILDDPVAVSLLGRDAQRRILATAAAYRKPEALALRSHVVLRSRFAEDRLRDAVGRGVAQYVVVGAGLDTFALRQPAWASALQIVEVDQAGSQAVKRARIGAAGLTVPENVIFAAIDFETESLSEGLCRNGVSTTRSTFFSWLGVTMYLTGAAIDATLGSMAAFPSGSEVVLTFLPPIANTSGASAAAASRLEQRVADAGEPFVSRFDAESCADRLVAAGFTRVDMLTPEIAGENYYRRRPADLPPPTRTEIASALRLS
jgi:methyltransferase (TIGR00027 family)